ncbi:phage tail protein [Acidaminococcus sp.]|uniref:phage tail protein n=1 Tax=Acidaminococcus sp. TaxID=1872103 RepID=UPI003D7E4039
MIDIDVRCEGAALLIQALTDAPEKAKRAVSMSVNKVARSTRTQMAREASKRYFVTVGNARKTIQVAKLASIDNLKAEITSRGYPISLAHFKVSPKKVQHKGRKNKKIRARVKRNGGGATLDRAFIMAIGSGVGVFERDGKARKPIHKLFGPSVPSMLKNEEIQQELEKTTTEKLNKELNRQLARIVGK